MMHPAQFASGGLGQSGAIPTCRSESNTVSGVSSGMPQPDPFRTAVELAARFAALQLLPENARYTSLLSDHARAAVAHSAAAASAGAPPAAVVRAELARTGSSFDDPFECAFVEPINFIGGGYRLLTGGTPSAVFNLRILLHALFRRDVGTEIESFVRSARRLTLASLRLATHVCDLSALPRWVEAGDEVNGCHVPPDGDLPLRAVLLSEGELARIIRDDVEALEPILELVGRSDDNDGAPAPLVKCPGGEYVLVEPGGMATALSESLLNLALVAGMREQLVSALAETALDHLVADVRRMGWEPHGVLSAADAPLTSIVARFDMDKLAVITAVYDDLAGCDGSSPLPAWEAASLTSSLESHLRRVETGLLFGAPPVPNELLHVVVLVNAGRPSVFGLAEPQEPVLAPRVLLELENLEVIGMGRTDPLGLWEFARALDALHERTQVISFGALDEFTAWSENQSFYLGDDHRPTAVGFDGDYGRDARRKAAQMWDRHGVRVPDGGWTEVVRDEGDAGIPIYTLIGERDGQQRLLVEGDRLSVWVEAPATSEEAYHLAYESLTDAIAYWIWQFEPAIVGLHGPLGRDALRVHITIEDPDRWVQGLSNTGGLGVTVNAVAPRELEVQVDSSLLTDLAGPSNAGERRLMQAILGGIDALASEEARLGPAWIDAALETHAPLGDKKKINLLSRDSDPELVEGPVPPYRAVSPAATDRVLDELGEYLTREAALDVGPILGTRRTEVLNSAVSFHFRQLQELVKTLDARGLLEHLVARNEALIDREAHTRNTLRSRRAAYGGTALADDLRREIPEATNAAVALRFLIEFVTSQPPKGVRPFSLSVYDRLVAICAQIVSRGLTSDVIHYEIEDADVSMLASGRLGLADGPFRTGQQTHLNHLVPDQAQAVIELSQAERGSGRAQADADEVNAAAKAEWGFSLTELIQLFSTLQGYAEDAGVPVYVERRENLQARLSATLDWEEARVADAIDLLSLTQRADYLDPPNGFKRYELWPWRFNRSLSYLRRPLLVRRSGTSDEILWGVRQIARAGRFLASLIESERLQATSPEMKRVMTRLRQAETLAFVERVGARCRSMNMTVTTNVKKVGGTRLKRANGDDLGDLDVLAVDLNRRIIFALECKDLEGARTPAELHNELTSVFAMGGPKSSAAERHAERTAWIESRIDETLRHLGVETGAHGWIVRGSIVTDVPVLSPYVAESPLPVLYFNELGAALTDENSESWPI